MTTFKVLLIDDDVTNNLINKEILLMVDSRFEVETIESAEGAIHYIKQLGAPDLIFLDINMAGMSGFEFLQWAKENPHLASKIVVLTAIPLNEEKVNQLNQLGCNDILVKPITIEKIENLLKVSKVED